MAASSYSGEVLAQASASAGNAVSCPYQCAPPKKCPQTLTTSRFFREATGARVYKQKLGKLGVKVVAIHQQVTDDPMGSVVEGIFELIDQYESDMNGFHTLRAMKENARKGFYNGSRPKFGFMVEKRGEGSSQE